MSTPPGDGDDLAAGFKVADDVRTTERAARYAALADEVRGERWATRETFRLDAGGLVDDPLRHVAGSSRGGRAVM